MRKIFYLLLFTFSLLSCKDQDVEFPDFDYQAVYFPLQSPLRTLSLGEDLVDNSLDQKLMFDIGVSIGGMYENYKDWAVEFIIDESLTDSMYNIDGRKIFPLPKAYYTLTPESVAVIPKGFFNGRIRVSLTEHFLMDSLSISGQYVVPLRIIKTDADSVLSGLSIVPNADRRIKTDYMSGRYPKDFVVYGIKFFNPYHGSFLQKGRDIRFKNGSPIDTAIYSEKYFERNAIVKCNTLSINKIRTNFVSINRSDEGTHCMDLVINSDNGDVEIIPVATSNFRASGNGKFLSISESKEEWGGRKRPTFYLNYSYTNGDFTHLVTDTLVFRDRGLKYEEILFQINR